MHYQKEQLWGSVCALSAQTLLSQPELKSAVDERNANATAAPILEKRLARGAPGTSLSEPQAGPAHPDVICEAEPLPPQRHQTRMAEERVLGRLLLASGDAGAPTRVRHER